MKTRIALFVLVLCLLAVSACAQSVGYSQRTAEASFGSNQYDGSYIIPDSSTRRLTEAELWNYQYDTLGYVLNEIFARHGYHFEPGSQYDRYFRATGWYRENTFYASNEAIYQQEMTGIEWYNDSLIKKVRADMNALGTRNPEGMSLDDVRYGDKPYEIAFDWGHTYFSGGQKLNVYNGPGRQYAQAGNGKARAGTTDRVAVAGIVDGYALILYETSNGYRSGYVSLADTADTLVARVLHFPAQNGYVLTADCQLTADPHSTMRLCSLRYDTPVTWLARCGSQTYIEVYAGGELLRGFVPTTCVGYPSPTFDRMAE